MASTLLSLSTLLLCLALVFADSEQFLPYGGALNRGGTASQAGNLAASAYGKQAAAASNQASQAVRASQGERAAAEAAAAREASAYGKNAYEQRIAQQLTGVLSYCEGYICTEWLDEYGAAYTNAGAQAYQSAEGYGQQSQAARQNSAADRAAYAAQQQNALGEQYGNQVGQVRGAEAYGQNAAGSQGGWAAPGFYGVPYGAGGLSGSQASSLGLNANAQQIGSLAASQTAAQRARADQGERANVAEAAAAQADAAMANAAAAKQSAFTVEQLSRLKNYGRKCRRYQCYHKYWDGATYSYGPNYYTAQGQAVRENQAQAANQDAYGNQDAAARQAASAAEEGAARQYGAGALGANEAAYGSQYGNGWY